jgi:hypothetical protein
MKSLPIAAVLFAAAAVSFAFQDAAGLIPKNSPSDYQTSQDGPDLTIAASLISPGQASKLFTSAVSAKYIVVEIAVFPKPGRDVDIHFLDFDLKNSSGGKTHPADPHSVANVWSQGRSALPNSTPAVTRLGPEYGSAAYPATLPLDPRATTAAGAGIRNSPPLFAGSPNALSLEAKLRSFALPQGRAHRAVAGYLYFPVMKRKKDDAPELGYLQPGGATIRLPLHP